MIFDIALLSSYTISAALLFCLARGVQSIRGILIKTKIKSNEFTTNDLNRVHFYLKIVFFFLPVIGISKLVALISMPVELKNAVYAGLYSTPLIFINSQIVSLFILIIFSFSLLLFFNMRAESKSPYLSSVFKYMAWYTIIDIGALSAQHYMITLELSLNTFRSFEPIFAQFKLSVPILAVSLVISLAVFSIIYFLIRKRAHQNKQFLLYFFYIIVAALAIFLTMYNLEFIISPQLAADFSLKLYSYPYWYVGFFWSLLVLSGLAAVVMSIIVEKLHPQFMSSNFSINYKIQLNRITLTSLAGMSAIAIIIPLLTKILN